MNQIINLSNSLKSKERDREIKLEINRVSRERKISFLITLFEAAFAFKIFFIIMLI